MCAAHSNTKGLICGYVGIAVILFVMSEAVSVIMGSGFVISTPNVSIPIFIL